MNKILNQVQKLCQPAQVYFIISVVSFLAMLMQNCSGSTSYKIGTFEAASPCHPANFFIIKALYILAWTYGLNYLCKNGFKTVSWAIVLLPLLGMFIGIGMLMFALIKKENFETEHMDLDEGFDSEEEPEDADGNTEGFANSEDEDDEDEDEDTFRPVNPKGAPSIEGFYEGNTGKCNQEEGEVWDEGANECVQKSSFTNREGFREGASTLSNPCGDGEVWNEDKEKCVEKFTLREGNEDSCGEGQYWDENTKKCTEGFTEGKDEESEDEEIINDTEGFEVGGTIWPQIGSIM